MVIGDNFVFIHNPKAGGTSVRCALRPYGVTDKQHAGLFPPRGYQTYPHRIVIVRNPYDRMVSGYEYSMRKAKEKPTFEEWILSEDPWMIGPFDFRRVPQSYWAWGCNKVLRFENLEKEFNQLKTELGIETSLPHENPSKREGDYRAYYTKKAYEVVTDRCMPDLVKYGYKFNATA